MKNDYWMSCKEAATYLSLSVRSIKRGILNGKNPDLQLKRAGSDKQPTFRRLKSSIDKIRHYRT